jgi:hypothetical protein
MARKSGTESANEQVQATVDAENEQGFIGTKADPTPNEHYTVAGVLAGKPTPETDPKAAAEAAQATSRAPKVVD